MQASARGVALPRSRAFQALQAIAAIALLTQPVPARAQRPAANVPNFGQINENYYRGGQPDAAGFDDLKQLGIKTVINLRGDAIPAEAGWVRDRKMQYVQIPLSTRRPATAAETEHFLQVVNDPSNQPVFVHCQGGRHRAGEMTALYRITHDSWTADEAYQEMKRYKFYSFPFQGVLRDYVFQYYDRHRLELAATKPAGAAGAAATEGAAANK
jgi:protein tyrosine/serine phosphatase